MIKFSRLLLAATLVGINVASHAQNVSSPYQVGTWWGFRDAAVSYTFDDNCSNQLPIAVPMFDSLGLKLTLFAVTNWSPNWNGLTIAASHGHEIGDHTVSHPRIDTMTAEQQKREVITALRLINAKIPAQKCISLAYPFCVGVSDSLWAPYFVAARACQGIINPSTPPNFMKISSIVCGNTGSIRTAKSFQIKADSVALLKGWLVYLVHGIDYDDGCCQLSSGELRAGLQYLVANKQKFWVSAFGTVARYIKERNSLSVTETSNRDTSITLQAVDTLDNAIYTVPVTIRRPLPTGWESATATQNGAAINVSVVKVESTSYIMFDVVPNGGEIQLTEVTTPPN
ncbi:MAG TPA: polysaccharide deacetylase family protein [Bacteroidota bacterium]|nr:polysaccharide deacetylase family protein [Bacteroidota bacterium]